MPSAAPQVGDVRLMGRAAYSMSVSRDGSAAGLDGDLDVGGPTLAASLVRLGLVEEYIPCVRPMILGEGQTFLQAPRVAAALRPIDARMFGAGGVALRDDRVRPA